MGEAVVQKLTELSELAEDVHWLCPRTNARPADLCFDEDVLDSIPTETADAKAKRLQKVKEAQKRRDDVLEACTIFAFDGDDARPYQDMFQAGLHRQLTRCEVCVREYHRSRSLLIQKLEAQFDGEEVKLFISKFDRMNIDRIASGLKDMTEALLDMPPQERKLLAVGQEAMYALFEALTCEPFLNDQEALELYFDHPFRLLQTNKKVKLPSYAPGMVAFMFSRNDDRLSWALRNFPSVKRPLTGTEFQHSVRPFLEAATRRVLISNLDKDFLPAFWRGAKLVTDKLTKDVVHTNLRAMDNNICRVGMEHFQIDSSHFADLLASFQALITISPSDFWGALGSITPKNVADVVFVSPTLKQLLRNDREREPLYLEQKMDFAVQIIDSVKPANVVAPLRSLIHHLLHDFQGDSYSRYARNVCWEKGLACLLHAIQSVKNSVPGGPIVTDLIAFISEKQIQLIVQELDAIEKDDNGLNLDTPEILSLEIIEKALALDVSELARDRKYITDKRALDHKLSTSNIPLWQVSMRHIKPGSADMAASVLSGISGLLALEKFPAREIQHAPKHTEDWNNALKRVLQHICTDLLQTLDGFHPDDLDRIYIDYRASQGLIGLLFNGDAEVHQAALNVLKVLGNEDGRRDSIKHILETFHSQTIEAVIYALDTITSHRVYEPSPVALKICTDIFSCLCDTADGVLRSKRNFEGTELAGMYKYWRRTWSLLGMIFEQTEPWSNRGYDKQLLQDFCRETMDFAEYVFEQYSLFASTFQHAGSGSKSEDMRAKLLQAPKSIFHHITKWLRLRDEYLVEKAVSLTRNMLGRLLEVDIRIDDAAVRNIENIVLSTHKDTRIKTKLSSGQKAILQQALENHLGESLAGVIDVDALEDRPKKQTNMQDWVSSGRSSGASTPTSTSGKPGKLDMNAWSDAAKRNKDIAKTEHAEMQKLYGGLTTAQAEFKRRQAQAEEQKRRKLIASKAAAKNDPSDFLAERKKAKEEAEQKRQAAIAKAKGVGVGSGVRGLGDIGKDHSMKGQNVMISSDEESSDDDDDLDQDLFGTNPKKERRQRPEIERVQGAVPLKPDGKPAPTKIRRMQRNARDMRARLAPDLSSLHKSMLAWEFFHTGDYPPESNEHQFRQVAKAFQDPTTYQQTFQPLLLLEAWQGIVRAREENSNKEYDVKITNRTNVDSFIEFTSAIRHDENRVLQLSEGDIILLSKAKTKLTEDDSAPHALARISRIKRQKAFNELIYQTMPGSAIGSSLVGGNSVKGVKVQTITPLEREYGALQGLQYYDLCMQILRAMPSPRTHLSDREIQSAMDIWNVNRAQGEAINAAMQNEGFSLIQGPPGSGKTKTIVAIVGGLLTQALSGSSHQGQRITMPGGNNADISAPPKKLLVCAPSNAAVDELVMRLKEGVKARNGKTYPLNVVRIGRSDAINTQVVDVTMDELVAKKMGGNEVDQKKRDANQVVFKEHQEVSAKLSSAREQEQSGTAQGKEASELRDAIAGLAKRKRELGVKIDNIKDSERNAGREADLNRKRAQQAVLDQAHVICATLSGSGHDMFQSLNIEFETVIIDEAAQCVEMSSLIPLKYGCVKCIMVGDPKQLPPTVFSKEAAKFQYEQSLFVRMQANAPDVVYLLDTQYRMHPDISLFPSRSFYDGLLKDGNGMAGMRVRPWHSSSLLAPYRFFDVKGQHQSAPRGKSLVNYAEIDVAMALFERLTTDFRNYDYLGKVGIITPYRSQLYALKDRFSSRFGSTISDTIEFNTTDAFQGRESEIIIFSCVRASPGKGIGFLQDIRRMNVGLTRAKSSLWVLGNSQTLVSGDWWKKLVVDAQERDAYVTGDLMSMLRQRSTTHPASGQNVTSMHDVGDHTPQMANGGANGHGATPETARMASREQVSEKPSKGQPTAKRPAPKDGDRMEGIKYRAEDRIAHYKQQATSASEASSNRSTPARSEAADVDMEDAGDGATDLKDETSLPKANGGAGDQVNGTGGGAVSKPRPVLVPQAPPPPMRKRAPPNPFMPKKAQRKPG